MEKWVVVLDTEPCVIGPFKSYEDARLYQVTDHEADNMRTMEIVSPAHGWKQDTNRGRKANV